MTNMTDPKNSTNCSMEGVDEVMQYMELAIYIPIFISGLTLNVMALLAFCVFIRKWTESIIYMTSLALMGLVLLLPLPFKMHAANNKWFAHRGPLCSFLESLYFIGTYGTIYTITCIAVDRWVAICNPIKAKQLRSPRAARLICVAVWLLVLLTISPVSSSFRDKNTPDQFHCFHGFSEKGWKPVVIVCVLVFGFLGPALVVVYCSLQNIWTLQKSGQHSAKSQACVRIIYSSLSAFLVPFTPSHMGILLQFLVHQGVITDCDSKRRISLFLQLAMSLSNITCCLDALCFYFIIHERMSIKNTFRMSAMSQRRPTISTSEL